MQCQQLSATQGLAATSQGGEAVNQVSAHLPGILLAYSAFLLSIMSPGPNVLAILGTSMSVGRSSGVALALGVATGSFFWAILTFSGLSALLASYAAALMIIKIAGGLYLLWLAYRAFRSAASAHDIEANMVAGPNQSLSRPFLHGLGVQMTNPKAALAWIAILSLGVQADSPLWVGLSIVTGTSLLSLLIHFLYAVAFSTTAMVRLYGKARRWIQGALGAFFAFAGLKLLASRS
jgi:amino acid exporter